jgi:site-specific DNA-cytosine methylase
MRYASVCDGIGAVHVAWKPLGWECAWTSEIEPFPAAVVHHHHELINLGDMTKITETMLNDVPSGAVKLLAGGTPCQSFSVAGLRGGLGDARGNLALRFCQLAATIRPEWIVWENVPGVLSINGGRDFGAFLGALANIGYGFAYRVLDAQWFGVAQRRRRVFLVANARDWRRAAAVLFESESLCGNPPTRGEAGKETAGTLVSRAGRNGGASNADADAGHLITGPLTTRPCRNELDDGHLVCRDVASSLVKSGRGAARAGESRGQDDIVAVFGGNNHSGPVEVAASLLSHGGSHGHMDFATETFVVSDDPVHGICANEQRTYTNEGSVFQLRNVVGHPGTWALRNDAGRTGEAKTPSPDAEGRVRLRGAGFNVHEDIAPTLDATQPHSVLADNPVVVPFRRISREARTEHRRTYRHRSLLTPTKAIKTRSCLHSTLPRSPTPTTDQGCGQMIPATRSTTVVIPLRSPDRRWRSAG